MVAACRRRASELRLAEHAGPASHHLALHVAPAHVAEIAQTAHLEVRRVGTALLRSREHLIREMMRTELHFSFNGLSTSLARRQAQVILLLAGVNEIAQ